MVPNNQGHWASPGRHGQRLQSAFIVVQLAMSLVLLFATGELLGALWRASRVELGFQPDGVSMVSYDLVLQNYPPERRAAFHRDARGRLAALPGVDGVALANLAPLGGIMVGERSRRAGATTTPRAACG